MYMYMYIFTDTHVHYTLSSSRAEVRGWLQSTSFWRHSLSRKSLNAARTMTTITNSTTQPLSSHQPGIMWHASTVIVILYKEEFTSMTTWTYMYIITNSTTQNVTHYPTKSPTTDTMWHASTVINRKNYRRSSQDYMNVHVHVYAHLTNLVYGIQ